MSFCVNLKSLYIVLKSPLSGLNSWITKKHLGALISNPLFHLAQSLENDLNHTLISNPCPINLMSHCVNLKSLYIVLKSLCINLMSHCIDLKSLYVNLKSLLTFCVNLKSL